MEPGVAVKSTSLPWTFSASHAGPGMAVGPTLTRMLTNRSPMPAFANATACVAEGPPCASRNVSDAGAQVTMGCDVTWMVTEMVLLSGAEAEPEVVMEPE